MLEKKQERKTTSLCIFFLNLFICINGAKATIFLSSENTAEYHRSLIAVFTAAYKLFTADCELSVGLLGVIVNQGPGVLMGVYIWNCH